MDYTNISTVIFSHPPIGTVGMSEMDAVKMYGKDRVRIYTSKFVNMFYSLMPADKPRPQTYFKLVTLKSDENEEIVIGTHGIGKGIDEMMQTLGVLVKMGAKK